MDSRYRTGENRSNAALAYAQQRKQKWASIILAGTFGATIFLAIALVVSQQRGIGNTGGPVLTFRSLAASRSSNGAHVDSVRVFSRFVDNPVAQKQRSDFEASPVVLELTAFTLQQEADLLRSVTHAPDNVKTCAPGVLQRHQELISNDMPHMAHELFKYCQLYLYGGLYIDGESPLLSDVQELLGKHSTQNLAVLGDGDSFPHTLHGSLLFLKQPNSPVAKEMLQVLMETPLPALAASPLLLPKALYQLVQRDSDSSNHFKPGSNGRKWYLFQQACTVNPLLTTTPLLRDVTGKGILRFTHHCPMHTGYCCHAYDADQPNSVILMTKHPLLPYQLVPPNLPRPYNAEAGHYQEDELPFLATISEKVMRRPDEPPVTPNFFDMLMENDCLPSDIKCSNCLRDKKGATCESCKHLCPCFCKTLCKVEVEEKFVAKELTITPPLYAKDPSRIIPRIVHQTWFEDVTKEKYPNMSRLIQSFKQSGWEYKFYTDDVAANFLSTHFPAEVREAYDTLRPGAFKADLFRYCVLLIHGGVYADMDVMLESNLDAAIAPDIGFMVPMDEPGKPVGHRMCLWNGFIAAAPGHPFLAKVVETVVNHVRNRFTSVDMDHEFCPNPEMSVLHAFDTLFTAGPCILGATLNRVLGRNAQTQFEAGDIEPWTDKQRSRSGKGTSFVVGTDDKVNLRLPGRTVILHQDKWDMGAHRFTWLDENMVVCATDMPDYDDRKQLEDNEHYSKTHVKTGVYGLDRLYTDAKKANEDIRMFVNAESNRHKAAIAES